MSVARRAGAIGCQAALLLAESGGVLSVAAMAREMGVDRHTVALGLRRALQAGLVERVHERGWRLSGVLGTTQPCLFPLSGVLGTIQALSGSENHHSGLKKKKEEDNHIVARVRYLYASEIGPVTEAIARQIRAAVAEHDELSVWEEAFDAAAGRNVRNWRYVWQCVKRAHNPLLAVRAR